mmetsp:Transcript_11981/g.19864  ORF Transcript_11981/g.19864 Transcript_11981/m.19864 type:complete len:135 (-) Transcript_11981:133-537(-)
MSRIQSLLRCMAILASAILFAAFSVDAEGFSFKCPFKCPTDDSYDPACLRSVIPPWPICLFKNVDDFVDHAQDSAIRCCGDDTSDCRCPKKDTDKFQDSIGEWCKGVASCGIEMSPDDADASAVEADNLEISAE